MSRLLAIARRQRQEKQYYVIQDPALSPATDQFKRYAKHLSRFKLCHNSSVLGHKQACLLERDGSDFILKYLHQHLKLLGRPLRLAKNQKSCRSARTAA